MAPPMFEKDFSIESCPKGKRVDHLDRDKPLCALAGLTGFWRQKVREREISLVLV